MESGKEVLLLKTLLVQHQQARRWLSPFIVTCSIYFLLWIPESQSTWVSALVRSLPVLSLVAYPWALASGGSYAWLLQGGLVCSAVGNACLMWPEAFLHGVTAFAAAHFLYFCAFGLSPLQPALLLLTILASVVYYGLLLLHLEPDMFLPVAGYMLVVSAMLWRGLAQAPNPVRNLRVDAQSNSSLTLHWEVPQGPDSQSLTYWVQCTGDGGRNETQNTTDTSVTVQGLDAASWYTLSVWAEKDGASGSREVLNATTAPNPVRNLRVDARSNSSLTLHWEVPQGPDSQSLTYWVQCTGDGGRNQTQNTTDTSVTVHGLDAASRYTLSVWAEKDGASGSQVTLNTATAPNPVRNLRVDAQSNSSLTLHWEVPQGPDSQSLTYWVQCTGDGGRNETQNTTDTSVTVHGLDAASRYTLSVWAEKDGASGSREALNTATAPNPIRSLSLEGQTNSSITLSWEAPSGPELQDYTYWVQCTGDSDKNETQYTTSTSVTAEALEPGTLYQFSVWAEKNGVPSSRQNLRMATVPNAVASLGKQDQTNNSITLSWTAPVGPTHPPYTYCVSWVKTGSTAASRNTSDTRITLTALEAGSLYHVTVWADRNEVRGYASTLMEATASSEVLHLKNASQTSNSETLRWQAPADPHSGLYTYWVQWAREEHPPREQDPA
ncbi:Hypothetical predicted protein [Marmota monax]|uniref:lysoplasmalogenase n=1 Tax=Marmota monax TaxID=9995 RepID=A0A5E4CGG5_MARMO|nr:Hypothetical predicted protein [Marmota monax]